MAAVTGGGNDHDMRVSPHDLMAAGRRLSDIAEDLATSGDQLEKSVEKLLNSWVGRSADAYGPAFDTWDEEWRTLAKSLADLGGALQSSARTYAEQDDTNASGFNNIDKELNL